MTGDIVRSLLVVLVCAALSGALAGLAFATWVYQARTTELFELAGSTLPMPLSARGARPRRGHNRRRAVVATRRLAPACLAAAVAVLLAAGLLVALLG